MTTTNKKIKSWAKTLTLTIISLIIATPTHALTPSQINMFSQNNIIFYDPGEENCASTTNYTTKPSGNQITWIGDSYSVGAESKITAKLPGVDLGSSPRNIQGSKSFAYDISGNETNSTRLSTHGDINVYNPAGLTILQHLKNNNSLRKYVVFALGTNDQGYDTAVFSSSIDELHAITGDSHTIILMTPRTLTYTYTNVIDAIRQSAQRYSNIIIADWENAVQANLNDYFDPSDTIHPNDKGYDLFVNTIYNALPGGSVSMLAGNNNAEKIWNYFAGANIPGVSDNPAVISGIIGNLQQESYGHINPFVISNSGTYFGIFQTTSPIRDAVNAAVPGAEQYWSTNAESGAPQDINDAALRVELEYLINVYSGWKPFSDNLDKVSNTGGLEGALSYAELFLAVVEIAYSTPNSSSYSHSQHLTDQKVNQFVRSRYATDHLVNNPTTKWQGRDGRVVNAQKIYTDFSGASASVVASAASSSGIASWDSDGWLEDNSIPGIVKEDAVSSGYTLDETPQNEYTGGKKPDKILLHYTAGTSNGIAAYGGNMFPPHFTINLKDKIGQQHFSVWKPSLASKGDIAGQIQIEIVGCNCETADYPSGTVDFVSKGLYLPNFTNEEWDYLAVLLIAIAEQTGIPLTTSVDWASTNTVMQYDSQEFLDYIGIIGHMHIQDDKIDPGNIWPQVSAAIARNPDGAKFANGKYTPECSLDNYATGLKPGGMNLAEAEAFMDQYKNITPNEWGSGGTLGTEWDIAATNCSGGDLANCVAFTQYFINRYTEAHYTGLPNGGGVVSQLLSDNTGFTDGGAIPRPYAVFSVPSGSMMCGNSLCGHTGIVLGINTDTNKIIIGEAGCSQELSWAGAHEKDLNDFVNTSYKYAYTDGILKGL